MLRVRVRWCLLCLGYGEDLTRRTQLVVFQVFFIFLFVTFVTVKLIYHCKIYFLMFLHSADAQKIQLCNCSSTKTKFENYTFTHTPIYLNSKTSGHPAASFFLIPQYKFTTKSTYTKSSGLRCCLSKMSSLWNFV